MVLAGSNSGAGAGGSDLPLYYKEISEAKRACRFCIKPIQTIQPRGEKQLDSINVQVVRGKTTTFIHLDEDEAKKVQIHGDYVIKKLQKIHKSVIWNCMVGRSFADKIQRGKSGSEEVNIDHDENSEFEPTNPKTWSNDSLEFIESLLKANEFAFDGYVILFCVANDPKDTTVDYDELAWELEKCLTYHFIANRSQIIMNEEAIMSRKGLDPVSRKTKTPGKKKSGFCVYLAYQLLDSITADQMVGEAINKNVDLSIKKKQLLSALAEIKLMPQVDERLRKQIKEMKEFLTKDQLELVGKIREVKETDGINMINEFLTFVKSGKDRTSGMMGLPQFLSFLNKAGESEADGGKTPRASTKATSVSSPRGATGATPKGSVLPRPASGRKPSVSSQHTYSISSRSTTPDTPRNGNGRLPGQRRESSLASIPSSGSQHSTPEPKRPQTASKLPSRTSRAVKPPTRPSTAKASSTTSNRRTDSGGGSRSGTPRGVGSSRSSANGDSPRLTPTGSPRMTSSTSGIRKTARKPPADGKMITREDLRRMNRSYPSPGKSAGSFSRASIPMS